MKANKYEVVVSNVGTVCSTEDAMVAKIAFDCYRKASELGTPGCRGFGEDVTLLCDGEPEMEHQAKKGEVM